MKKCLIILTLIFAVVGCADDDKGSKSSNNIKDNTSYDNNTGYTYHVVVDSVSHISKDEDMSQWGYLPCYKASNAMNNVLADKLGRPTDNTTKVCYFNMFARNSNGFNEDSISLFDDDSCDYVREIFYMITEPYIPTSIAMQYIINQIKTNPYENRYQKDVYITVDENSNIVEIK